MLGLFSILLQPCCLNALPSQASALWVFNEVSLLQDPPDALTGSVEAAEDTQAQEATWINSLRQFEDRNINEEDQRHVFVYDEKDDDSNAQKSSRHEYDDDEDYSWDRRLQIDESDSDEKISSHSDYDAQEISLHDDDAKKISFHEDDDAMDRSRHDEDANEISFNDDQAPAEGRQQDTESYEELLQILDVEIGEIFSLNMSFFISSLLSKLFFQFNSNFVKLIITIFLSLTKFSPRGDKERHSDYFNFLQITARSISHCSNLSTHFLLHTSGKFVLISNLHIIFAFSCWKIVSAHIQTSLVRIFFLCPSKFLANMASPCFV